MKRNSTDWGAILLGFLLLALLWFLYGRMGAGTPPIADTDKKIVANNVGDTETEPTNDLPDWLKYLIEEDYTATDSVDGYQGDTQLSRATATPFLARYGFINKLEEKSSVEDCTFPDANSKSDELQKTIIVACAYHLLRGSNGNFIPDRLMTRDELLTTLVRSKTGFLDESVDPWFKNYFDYAAKNGLIEEGEDINSFSDVVTKTDMGQRLYRLSLIQ